jgi:hypothetical protein
MTEQERSKRDRIERLRKRLKELASLSPVAVQLRDVINGILDLLADEL